MTSTPAPQSLVLPMRSVLRSTAIATGIALPVAVGAGFLIDGAAGVWGALLGIGLPLLFFTVTVVVALATARMQPGQFGVAVLATWLLKLVGLIAAMAVLRGMDFYNRPVLFVTVLAGTIGYLVLEAFIVARTKVLYVETEFAPDPS